MGQTAQLIRAMKANSEVVVNLKTFADIATDVVVETFNGDQMTVLIRTINNNTALLKETEDYRINNPRVINAENIRGESLVTGTLT